MKKLVLLIGILVAAPSLASEIPTVKCHLRITRQYREDRKVLLRGSVVSDTGRLVFAEVDGFKLEANLREICASDGGPCRGHELGMTISRGEVSTFAGHTVGSAPHDRLSAALQLGEDLAFVNCDIVIQK